MIVCVLKHTPAVYKYTLPDNETIFTGLEIEVGVFGYQHICASQSRGQFN